MAVPTAQKIKVQVWLAHGDTAGDEQVLLEFVQSSLTGNVKGAISKEYAAAATNQTVDLSTFCDTASWICIKDEGGTGLNVALDSSATAKFQIAANSFLLYQNRNATPPTVYITNPDGGNAAYLTIFVLGTRS